MREPSSDQREQGVSVSLNTARFSTGVLKALAKGGHYFYPHFTIGETEAWKKAVTWSRSPSRLELCIEPGSSESQSSELSIRQPHCLLQSLGAAVLAYMIKPGLRDAISL